MTELNPDQPSLPSLTDQTKNPAASEKKDLTSLTDTMQAHAGGDSVTASSAGPGSVALEATATLTAAESVTEDGFSNAATRAPNTPDATGATGATNPPGELAPPSGPLDFAPLDSSLISAAADLAPLESLDAFNLSGSSLGEALHADLSTFSPPLSTELADRSESSASPSVSAALSSAVQSANATTVGEPIVEGLPAFSVCLWANNGGFTQKQIDLLRGVLERDDYGVRFEDLAVQVEGGKILIPQISEFAAVRIAQQLHDSIENIELDLAGELFQSQQFTKDDTVPHYLLTALSPASQSREGAADLAIDPKVPADLFTSTLDNPPAGVTVTRTLSALLASTVISKDDWIAGDSTSDVGSAADKRPQSGAFAEATQRLTADLLQQAFSLGAHGIVGLKFTFHPIVGRNAFRLLCTGTAVRVGAV